MRIGYACVPTGEQKLDLHEEAECDRVYEEHTSGARPGIDWNCKMLSFHFWIVRRSSTCTLARTALPATTSTTRRVFSERRIMAMQIAAASDAVRPLPDP
jgi:hypothetical protein